jgi:hypothetical protein
VEPCLQAAQNITVFHGSRFLGYGASGILNPKAAKQLGSLSAQYAGFRFDLGPGATGGESGRFRLFVLSRDGRAAELPFTGRASTASLA